MPQEPGNRGSAAASAPVVSAKSVKSAVKYNRPRNPRKQFIPCAPGRSRSITNPTDQYRQYRNHHLHYLPHLLVKKTIPFAVVSEFIPKAPLKILVVRMVKYLRSIELIIAIMIREFCQNARLPCMKIESRPQWGFPESVSSTLSQPYLLACSTLTCSTALRRPPPPLRY